MKPTTMQLTVVGTNSLNKASLEILQAIIPQVEKYTGKSILIATGLSAKFKIDKPEIKADALNNEHASCMYYFEHTSQSLWLRVRVCLNGGSYDVRPQTNYTQYFEHKFYLGQINDGVLIEVETVEKIEQGYNLNTVIVEAEELAKIERLKQLAEELKAVKRSIRISEETYKHLLY